VQQAIVAMAGIERSSTEVSRIIGVIDEIAFQTNLLALNAGVEAARAGEQGKGFAVVAQEVRELAQRCTVAAQEIKGLIGSSEQQVKDGVDLVGRAAGLLNQISQQVIAINDRVQEISHAAAEQALGLEEINSAVSHMDQITQQNASMVEELTAGSVTLDQESSGLRERVLRFKVSGREDSDIEETARHVA
jgi:methyl-accepting chemotaxis protein